MCRQRKLKNNSAVHSAQQRREDRRRINQLEGELEREKQRSGTFRTRWQNVDAKLTETEQRFAREAEERTHAQDELDVPAPFDEGSCRKETSRGGAHQGVSKTSDSGSNDLTADRDNANVGRTG